MPFLATTKSQFMVDKNIYLNRFYDRWMLRLKAIEREYYLIGYKKLQRYDENILYFAPLWLLRQEHHLAPSMFNINKRE